MKIVAYSSAVAFGGHEVMALKGIRALLNAGHEVEFFHSLANEKLTAMLKELSAEHGARFRPMAMSFRARRFQIAFTWLDWRTVLALMQAIKKSGPDLLLVLQGDIEQGSEAIVAGWLARSCTISYIPMVMGGRERGIRFARLRDILSRPLYAMVQRMIVISPMFLERAKQLGVRDAEMVYNSIDDEFFISSSCRREARAALKIAHGENVCGYIGRLAFQQKGLDRLIEILSHDPGYFRQNRMLIVGSGPEEERLKSALRVNNLDDCVIQRQWDDGRMRIFDAMDVFLCVSRFEGVPLTVLEASARRIPVISVALPTLTDHLPLDFLSGPFDPSAWIARIGAVGEAGGPNSNAAFIAVERLAKSATFESKFVRAVTRTPVRDSGSGSESEGEWQIQP